MEVGDGQHVGDAERLADVALALHLAHAQRVAADAVGALGQADVGRARAAGRLLLMRALRPSARGSVDEHAAVDVDDGAGDVGGEVGGEEQVDVGDVVGVAEAAERDALDDLGLASRR